MTRAEGRGFTNSASQGPQFWAFSSYQASRPLFGPSFLCSSFSPHTWILAIRAPLLVHGAGRAFLPVSLYLGFSGVPFTTPAL